MLPAIMAAARMAKRGKAIGKLKAGSRSVSQGAARLRSNAAAIQQSQAMQRLGQGAGITARKLALPAGVAALGMASAGTKKLTKNVATADLRVIVVTLIADLLIIDGLLRGTNTALMIHGIMAVLLYFVLMKGDKLILAILAVNLLPLIVGIIPGSQFTKILANTVSNPFIPWWFIYSGFLRNPREGKLSNLLFWLFFIAFLAVGYTFGGARIAESANIEYEITPEQYKYFEAGKEGLINSVVTLGNDAWDGVKGVPRAFMAFIIPPDLKEQLGLEERSQAKQRVRFGIRISPYERGAIERGKDVIEVRAKIKMISPLPDQSNFITLSGIKCTYEVDGEEKTGAIKDPKQFENAKIYYGSPRTVSCSLSKSEIESEDVSSVKISAQYDFSSNGLLKTYFMEETLLENLLDRGEDRGRYMGGLTYSDLNPVTLYDNGPLIIGMGPIELNKPPLGIKESKTYPDFELLLKNNRKEFNGEIVKVNSIELIVPEGVSLSGCDLNDEGNRYTYNPNDNVPDQDLTDSGQKGILHIEEQEEIVCPMNIDISALRGQSYSEVEFSVDVDYTYEISNTLSTKVE